MARLDWSFRALVQVTKDVLLAQNDDLIFPVTFFLLCLFLSLGHLSSFRLQFTDVMSMKKILEIMNETKE